jgi:purine-binding chemotaxis protein CheW
MEKYLKPVIFRLDEQRYGIDISIVNAIEKQVELVPMPDAADHIKGVINLRGEVIPVLNLKEKFNMDSRSTEKESAIIIKIGEMIVALEVDAVEGIHDVEENAVIDMPVIIKNNRIKYFDKLTKINNSLVVLIDEQYLLSENEQESVKSIATDLE